MWKKLHKFITNVMSNEQMLWTCGKITTHIFGY